MPKKKKPIGRKILAWLEKNPDGNRAAFMKHTAIEVPASTFCGWRKKFLAAHGKSPKKIKRTGICEVIREWLRKNPDGNHADFVEDTGKKVPRTTFDNTRYRLFKKLHPGKTTGRGKYERKKKGKGKASKKKVRRRGIGKSIRAWLIENPEGNRAEFVQYYGEEVSSSIFSYNKIKFHQEYGREETGRGQAKKDLKKKLIKERQNFVGGLSDHISVLENENKYLKWRLSGERQGFVDKLLKDLSDE